MAWLGGEARKGFTEERLGQRNKGGEGGVLCQGTALLGTEGARAMAASRGGPGGSLLSRGWNSALPPFLVSHQFPRLVSICWNLAHHRSESQHTLGFHGLFLNLFP